MDKFQREQAFKEFKSGSIKYLIKTDLIAANLDFNDVNL